MFLKNADSDLLLKIGEFLGIKLVTGTHIISTIVKFAVNFPILVNNLLNKVFKFIPILKKFEPIFKLNYFPFEYFKRKLLSH